MKHANIIKSIFAVVAVAATGAWAEMETVGGYTLTDRINGGVCFSETQIQGKQSDLHDRSVCFAL